MGFIVGSVFGSRQSYEFAAIRRTKTSLKSQNERGARHRGASCRFARPTSEHQARLDLDGVHADPDARFGEALDVVAQLRLEPACPDADGRGAVEPRKPAHALRGADPGADVEREVGAHLRPYGQVALQVEVDRDHQLAALFGFVVVVQAEAHACREVLGDLHALDRVQVDAPGGPGADADGVAQVGFAVVLHAHGRLGPRRQEGRDGQGRRQEQLFHRLEV